MEITIRKPNEAVKVDKEAVKIHKMCEKAMKQARTYRGQSISIPVYTKNYIPSKWLFKYSLYAICFLSWFISWYLSY